MMPCFIYIYSASIVNHIKTPVNLITGLPDTSNKKHVLNEHGDFDQYGSCAIPSEIMQCHTYPTSLVNQHEIRSELSYRVN